jgi:Nucleotidyl transferase AbiEii toxin, Type IV TA system
MSSVFQGVASQMKLSASPEFRDAIIAAQEHFAQPGLTEQFIEKDYYVTEALRTISVHWQNNVIFKGGTSLSKGWNLIQRFSEDLDLFLNRDTYQPKLSKNQVTKKLRSIQDAVLDHPKFALEPTGRSEVGVSRTSYFTYPAIFPGLGNITNRVMIEMGTRSGNYPIATVQLSSYLAEFLQNTGESLGAEDESSFPMQLLHFRRTFVEKLFSIHSHVTEYQINGKPINTYARHYYDLFCLAGQPEVMQMLNSLEYQKIKEDVENISQEHFTFLHYTPTDLSFTNSPALFPTGELRTVITKEYQQQCKNLCYGDYPSWDKVSDTFEKMRNKL